MAVENQDQSYHSVTTGPNSAMNQWEFPDITRNLLKAREISHEQSAIGFAFAIGWKIGVRLFSQ